MISYTLSYLTRLFVYLLKGFGMVVGVVSMVLMGAVEMVRKYDLGVHGSIEQNVGGVQYNASRVRLFWQTPQFLLVGIAESFTLVSGDSVDGSYRFVAFA